MTRGKEMKVADSVLLKIKREFTNDEAVGLLLKMVSELEFEIGVLKSERDEMIDKLAVGKPKNHWLKDELIGELNSRNNRQMKKNTELEKKMNEWRNKYFSLIASQNQSK